MLLHGRHKRPEQHKHPIALKLTPCGVVYTKTASDVLHCFEMIKRTEAFHVTHISVLKLNEKAFSVGLFRCGDHGNCQTKSVYTPTGEFSSQGGP